MTEDGVETPLDGIWWAFVTLTTVGYGDIAPSSTTGRILAVALMLVGVTIVALITAATTARFVEEDEQDVAAEVERLHERLDVIEALLRIEATGHPPPHDRPRDKVTHA